MKKSLIIGEAETMDVQIDITDTILETKRLILRPWQESDLNDLYKYASIPGVGEMAGWKHHDSIKTSREILQSFIDGRDVFAIVHKETGKVIGSIGIHPSWANEDDNFKDLKVKEIGYVLSKEYWGKGLMPEAVKEVIRYCFETLGLDAVTCGHFSTNHQSKRVIEKCGFTFVKQGEYYSKPLQKNFDSMKYILFR